MKSFKKYVMNGIYIVVISFLLIYTIAFGQTTEDCLNCHGEPDITMDKNGKTVSLYVKKFALARSVHNKMKCVDCHAKYNPDDIPHNPKKQPINCMSCHNNVVSNHKFHPQMAKSAGISGSSDVNCKNCHGTHEITSPSQPNSKTNFTKSAVFCGGCHKSELADHKKSEHFTEVSKNNSNAPTCIFCHKNPITKGYNLDFAELKVQQEKLCLSCHLKNPSKQTQYSKNLISFDQSVHGKAILKGNHNAANCIDCHGTHNLQKAQSPESGINQSRIPEICGKCHISIAQEYAASIHGTALKRGIKDVPGCTYCHGEHNIRELPEVPKRVFEETHLKHSTVVRNKMVFCIVCHADKKMMSKYNILTVNEAHDWLPNPQTHWETVRCVDCHSSYSPPNMSHNILPPDKTVKKCEECHAQNSILMSKLYKHEKEKSREKFGFINGTVLSDAYVIGTTRNVFLDTFSLFIFGIIFLFLGFHGFMRWYFKRSDKKK